MMMRTALLVVAATMCMCTGTKPQKDEYLVTMNKGTTDEDFNEVWMKCLEMSTKIRPKKSTIGKSFKMIEVRMTEAEESKLCDELFSDKIHCDNNVGTVGNTITCPDVQEEPLAWGQKFLNLESNTESLNVGGFKHDATWGAGVDMFVVDSGVKCDHEELVGRCSTGANFIINEENVDFYGHGTHIAGTAAGTTYGIAKSLNVISVKVLDDTNQGTVAGFVEGLEWAINSALNKVPRVPTIINLSLGTNGVHQTFNAAIEAAEEEGLLVVIAAGNGGTDACNYSPSSVTTGLTVGLITMTDADVYKPHPQSNYGSCVDLYAPGMNVYSADSECHTCYALKSGTSNAAPHVVGIAAAYWSKNTGASLTDVKNFVKGNTISGLVDLPANSPDKMAHLPCADTMAKGTADPDYDPVEGNCHEHYVYHARGAGTMSYPPASPPNSVHYKDYEYYCFKVSCYGSTLSLTWTHFDIENGYDYLTVDGTAYTGNSMPSVTSIQGSALLIFQSDYGTTKTGFSFDYVCNSLEGNDTHAPETDAPDTNSPPVPVTPPAPPATPTPVDVASGTTKFRITTGTVLYDGSVGTYDVTLAYTGGETASLTVVQPLTGSELVMEHVGGAGFPDATTLASVTIACQNMETSNDDWVIAKVEVWRSGVWWEKWQPVSLPDASVTLDLDSEIHPSSVSFASLVPARVPVTASFYTGNGQWDDSNVARYVSFTYRNGVEEEVGSFIPHTQSQYEYVNALSLTPAEDIVSMRIVVKGTTDLYTCFAAVINNEAWVTTSGSKTFTSDDVSGKSDITLVRRTMHTLKLRLSTTEASNGWFAVNLKFRGSNEFRAGTIIAPELGIQEFTTNHVLDTAEMLETVSISSTSADSWTIAYLEVQLAGGSWEKRVLAAHGNVEGGIAVAGTGPASLVFTSTTVPTTHTLTFSIETDSSTHSATIDKMRFNVVSKTGVSTYFEVQGFAFGTVDVSVTTLFGEADASTMSVTHVGAGDGWRYGAISMNLAGGGAAYFNNVVGWLSAGNSASFALPPPPAMGSITFQVRVTTYTSKYSDTGANCPVELKFADNSKVLAGYISSPGLGSVKTINADIVQDFSALQQIYIRNPSSGDGWRVSKVEVRESTGSWAVWSHISSSSSTIWLKNSAATWVA